MPLTVGVDGMTCSHCERAVRAAVSALPGVQAVSVDLATGTVQIQGDPDAAQLRAAIEEEGYRMR